MTPRAQRNGWRWAIFWATLWGALLVGCAENSGPRQVRVATGMITVPGVAYIDGRRPGGNDPYTYMQIGAVADFGQTTAHCTLRHGARVSVLEMQRVLGGLTPHFLVSDGNCTGWVTGAFLSPAYHEPVGRRVSVQQ